MNWLLEPFEPLFMQYTALAIVLSGATCAWIGVHVTLRKMSFFGDALAHATLPGIAIAHFLNFHMLIGALASALTAVFGVGWAARSAKTSNDSLIGVTYTGLFALGVIGSYRLGLQQDLTHILVGNPLGVSNADLAIISACAVVTGIGLLIGHRLLTTTLIDQQHAISIGQNPTLAHMLLLVLTAVTVVTAVSAVGLILTVGLLITPAATARLCCKGMRNMIIFAVSMCCFISIAGIIVSWHIEWPTGATIVLGLSLSYAVVRLGSSLLERSHLRTQASD